MSHANLPPCSSKGCKLLAKAGIGFNNRPFTQCEAHVEASRQAQERRMARQGLLNRMMARGHKSLSEVGVEAESCSGVKGVMPSQTEPEIFSTNHAQNDPKTSKNSNGKTKYMAERLLDKRTTNGLVEFRVKWMGYSVDEATWEPRMKLIHDIPLMIAAWDKLHRLNGSSASSSSVATSTSPVATTTPVAAKTNVSKTNVTPKTSTTQRCSAGTCNEPIAEGSTKEGTPYKLCIAHLRPFFRNRVKFPFPREKNSTAIASPPQNATNTTDATSTDVLHKANTSLRQERQEPTQSPPQMATPPPQVTGSEPPQLIPVVLPKPVDLPKPVPQPMPSPHAQEVKETKTPNTSNFSSVGAVGVGDKVGQWSQNPPQERIQIVAQLCPKLAASLNQLAAFTSLVCVWMKPEDRILANIITQDRWAIKDLSVLRFKFPVVTPSKNQENKKYLPLYLPLPDCCLDLLIHHPSQTTRWKYTFSQKINGQECTAEQITFLRKLMTEWVNLIHPHASSDLVNYLHLAKEKWAAVLSNYEDAMPVVATIETSAAMASAAQPVSASASAPAVAPASTTQPITAPASAKVTNTLSTAPAFAAALSGTATAASVSVAAAAAKLDVPGDIQSTHDYAAIMDPSIDPQTERLLKELQDETNLYEKEQRAIQAVQKDLYDVKRQNEATRGELQNTNENLKRLIETRRTEVKTLKRKREASQQELEAERERSVKLEAYRATQRTTLAKIHTMNVVSVDKIGDINASPQTAANAAANDNE